MRPFPYRLTGIASKLGRVVPIDEWAAEVPIPHRRKPDEMLSGDDIRHILGLESKSWDPELFSDFNTIQSTAMQALESAEMQPREIDAVVVLTATPYEIMMDQDAFRLMRNLGIPDDVVPIQCGAGCAGLMRAASMLSRMAAKRALIVAYHLPSLYMLVDGKPNPLYLENDCHPETSSLWGSPALFSDGAAAAIFQRSDDPDGYCGYSRDAIKFGDGPGFEHTLLSFKGGGAWHPPGSADCVPLSCYAMQAEPIKEYYVKGMTLNHQSMLESRPGYLEEVKRLYIHQARSALVKAFLTNAGIDEGLIPMKVGTSGNISAPSTLRWMHEDIASGWLEGADELCVSATGVGPERGIMIFRQNVKQIPPA